MIALVLGAFHPVMRFSAEDQLVIVVRTGLAAACGLVIGLERQLAHKVVGLRTHMLVAAAAGLATGMGELLFVVTGDGDPTRMLHAVVTGVGFIGAGAIFRGSSGLKGLTTAATLFIAAVLGAVTGLGAALLAGLATVVAVILLRVLLFAEERAQLRGVADDDD